MSLVKMIRFEENFVSIPNETVRDERLSDDTLGWLTRMASNKDGWKFNKESVSKQKGRRFTDRAFKELTEAGYMYIVPFRVGRMSKPVYLLRVVPFREEEITPLKQQAIADMQEYLDKELEAGRGKKYKWDVQNEQFILDCPKRTASKYNSLKENLSLNKKEEEENPLYIIENVKSKLSAELEILGEFGYNQVAMRCMEKHFEGAITYGFKAYFMKSVQEEASKKQQQAQKQQQTEEKKAKSKQPRRNTGKSVRKEELAESIIETQQGQQKALTYADMSLTELESMKSTFLEIVDINPSASEQLAKIEAEIASRLQVTG